MKKRRSLSIEGDQAGLDSFAEDVTRHLKDGWQRTNEKAGLRSKKEVPDLAFACKTRGKRRAATVWLCRADHGWQLLGIRAPYSKDTEPLTHDEHNLIVEEFSNECAMPSAARLGLSVSLGSATMDIQEFLSAKAYKALRRYLARRPPDGEHFYDEYSWQQFIVQAHIGRCDPHADMSKRELFAKTLQRWLVEEENFSDEAASGLSALYEEGLHLLECYDLFRDDEGGALEPKEDA